MPPPPFMRIRLSGGGGGVLDGTIEGLYVQYLDYQSVCPIDQIGSPPLPPASVSPSLEGSNTRLGVRGRGEPILTTGEKAWHSVYSVDGTMRTV
jgi:hypothetical protein